VPGKARPEYAKTMDNRLKINFVLALILIFSLFQVDAQPYYFRHYQVEDGLSNNAVVCCLQDNRGFLWFGTKDGLNRFDGYTFKTFRNQPENKNSLGNNFIHSLFADKEHTLWVGTDKGLFSYHETDEHFEVLPVANPGRVTDIKMDKSGTLWFISNFVLHAWLPATRELRAYPIDRFFEATAICTPDDGAVWVSTNTGLLQKFDNKRNQFTPYNLFSHSPTTASNWIENLYPTGDGKILAGTSNQGVKLFDPATSGYTDILTYNADNTEIFARDFLQVSEEEYWIATESGIYIYNSRTGTSTNLRKDYTNPYSISDNAVYTFCRDQEGGIWAGTYFGGINYYPRQALTFDKFFPGGGPYSISGNVVREIIEDQYGSLWMGTEDAGLNRYDISTGRFTNFQPTGRKDGIAYTNIHGLMATGDELWIGTFEHGLDVMSIKTGKVIRHYAKGNDSTQIRSNFIYCIYQSPDGEILIGTTIGAYRFNRGRNDFSLLPALPLHNWYTSILKDRNGLLWASTYGNGIYCMNEQTGQVINFLHDEKNKNSLSHDRVNKITEDSRGRLWIATENGLCLYEESSRSFKRFTTANGLPSSFILSIAEDSNRTLWIGTTKGLVHLNPETESINVFSKANGLLNDQFNFSSAFRDRAGNMYFGSVKGLIRFHPSTTDQRTFSPPVFITGFQVNNTELTIGAGGSPLDKSISFTDKIILNNRQSTFSIDFASLGYTAPEMSEYAYKMEGLDEDWIYLKTNRKVYFTNLPPGTYTFRVKTAAGNNSAVSRETSLIIVILPPWWASKTALALYVLLMIAITVYAARTYHHRLKEKNRRKIEHLEITKEKELYEAKMNFFTNIAHEIKTPLTLIKGPLEKVVRKAGAIPEIKDSLRIMEKNTTRLVELTNQLLDFRQTEIKEYSLSFTQANINDLTEESFTSFKPLAEQKNLQFNLILPSQQVQANIDTDAFSKIIYNLLGNAVKYAESRVLIELLPLERGDNCFTILVKNDGYLIPAAMKQKIFEPFFRLKETEKQKGTGIGLSLSLSLTDLHKGTLSLEDNPDNLNIFKLTIPLKQPAGYEATDTDH